ncbi:MAG: cell division protein FtsX [Nitrospira sp.]
MRWLLYWVREAWVNLRTNRATTIVAMVTTAFTFACVGIFVLSYVNLRNAAMWLQDDIKIIVYLDDDLSMEDMQTLRERLASDQVVADLRYISKEEALSEFRAQFPHDSHLLEGLGENPLPASFVITPAPGHRSPEAVDRWADQVRAMTGVAKIDYNQEWLDALFELVRYLELTAIGGGVILSAAAVTIIGNTIRLAFFARREEVAILQLVGATRSFIRLPYVLEGAVLGGGGGGLALGILKIGFEVFRHQIGSAGRFQGAEEMVSFFTPSIAAAFVVAGVGLGVVSSMISLRRFGERQA